MVGKIHSIYPPINNAALRQWKSALRTSADNKQINALFVQVSLPIYHAHDTLVNNSSTLFTCLLSFSSARSRRSTPARFPRCQRRQYSCHWETIISPSHIHAICTVLCRGPSSSTRTIRCHVPKSNWRLVYGRARDGPII